MDVNLDKSCSSRDFFFASMSFNALRENKIIAKISEFTVSLRDHPTVKRLQRENYMSIGVSFCTVHLNEIWTAMLAFWSESDFENVKLGSVQDGRQSQTYNCII